MRQAPSDTDSDGEKEGSLGAGQTLGQPGAPSGAPLFLEGHLRGRIMAGLQGNWEVTVVPLSDGATSSPIDQRSDDLPSDKSQRGC